MLPAAITNIHQAFREIKYMCVDDWEGDYRVVARQALKETFEAHMHYAIDAHLDAMRTQGLPDRRNGSYPRHLLTELGDLELDPPNPHVQRSGILKRFARRSLPWND